MLPCGDFRVAPMLTRLRLVPVVELPCTAEVRERMGPGPEPWWPGAPEAWEAHHATLAGVMGYGSVAGFPRGSGRYPVALLSPAALDLLLSLHCGDAEREEICGLFGGFVLADEHEALLLPQCCGSLADFASWQALARPEAYAEHFCVEGHPSPWASSDGEVIEIRCVDEHESFEPPAPQSLRIARSALAPALVEAEQVLAALEPHIDRWGRAAGLADLGDVLLRTPS